MYWNLRDYGTATWQDGDPDCDHQAPNGQGQTGQRASRTFTANQPYRDVCGKCGARRVDAQLGLEPTPEAFVANMVAVFAEVRRVLRPDGTCWVNLGDSYATGAGKACNGGGGAYSLPQPKLAMQPNRMPIPGLKPKDLVGIPWRVAFALQADGWYLRDAIVWAKGEVDEDNDLEGSPMPGSQRDRCTSAYELLFLLAKSQKYYFDQEAIKTSSGAILRNVWRINPEPWKGAHFATFPRKLVEPCIKAGTSEKGCCPKCSAPWERVTDMIPAPEPFRNGTDYADHTHEANPSKNKSRLHGLIKGSTIGWRPACSCPDAEPVPCTVFDPFNGAGTTGVVALALKRHYIGLDLSEDYLAQARRRIERPHQLLTRQREQAMPLFAHMEDTTS